MSSNWDHPICDSCWLKRNGESVSVRVTGVPFRNVCCFCGNETRGVFVRLNPGNIPYHVYHGEDDGDE